MCFFVVVVDVVVAAGIRIDKHRIGLSESHQFILMYCTHSWYSSNLESHGFKYTSRDLVAENTVFDESSSRHLTIAISHIILYIVVQVPVTIAIAKSKTKKYHINIIPDEMI